MQQKKIGDILYVFDITPYEITEDTSAEIIKVQQEVVAGFKELNDSLADKIVPYNYHIACVNMPEWAPYVDDVSPELAWSSNSATVTIGADDNVFPTLTNPHSVTVTYSSSDTTKATINASTGAITLAGAGNTTISATFAGNDTYEAQTVTYALTVQEAVEETKILAVNAINGSDPLAGEKIWDDTESDWAKDLSYYSSVSNEDHYDITLLVGHNYKIYNATITSMTEMFTDTPVGSQVDDHYDFTMPNSHVSCTVQASENNEEQPE